MTTPRNRTYWRRRELRLMQEEHQRAVAAAQRAQLQQMATAMQQAANRLVLDIAQDDAQQLGQLLPH